MAHLGDPEAHPLHGNKPRHHPVVVVGRRVAHLQPPVVLPAEQRDIILVGLFRRCRDGEPAVRDHDVNSLVLPMQTCRRQVVQLGKVCPAVPLHREPGQDPQLLLQRRVLRNPQLLSGSPVRPPELVDVEVALHGRHKHVHLLAQKIFSCLRVVLGLQRVVLHVARANRHAVARISLLPLNRVREIHVPVLVLVRAADENEILIIRHGALQHLPAVFQPLGAESLGIVSGGRDADHQLVGVCSRCLLQDGVLLRAFISVHLVRDDDVRIKGILSVRVAGQRDQLHAAAAQALIRQAVLEAVIQHPPPGVRQLLVCRV